MRISQMHVFRHADCGHNEHPISSNPISRLVEWRMDIGVVMLVKNEVQRLEGALAPILDQLAQVVVLDNGSTDGTQELLREKLGVEPIDAGRDAGAFFSKSALRNQGLAMLNTDWCLSLDADERLDPVDSICCGRIHRPREWPGCFCAGATSSNTARPSTITSAPCFDVA